MTIWKDSSGGLHDDMDGAALPLSSWPQGMTALTPAEAEVIQNPAPTQTQVIAALEASVQAHMDAQAQGAGYDSLLSAVSYAGSAKFGAQAAAFFAWRDACWTKCYEIETEVTTGARTIPAADALIAELPALTLPQ